MHKKEGKTGEDYDTTQRKGKTMKERKKNEALDDHEGEGVVIRKEKMR